MAGFLSKIGSFLGIGGKNTGGSKDASRDFDKYKTEITKLTEEYRDRLRRSGENPILQSLLGARSRSNALVNSFEASGRASLGRLREGLLDNARSASTLARVASVDGARIAGAGRGGLAFGGGAGALAARAGQSSALERSALLNNAMLNAEQQTLGFEQALFSGRLNAENLGMQGDLQGAQLIEMLRDRQDRLNLSELQAITGLAGGLSNTGLAGDSRSADRRFSLISSLLSSGGG